MTTATATPTKPVYSTAQLNTLGKCSMMYKLRYVDNATQNRRRASMFFGLITGNALQKLVLTYCGQPCSQEEATAFYIEAFREFFTAEQMPPHILDYCLMILQGIKTFDYTTSDGVVERIHLEALVAKLDLELKSIEKGLPWIYKGQDARSKQDRFFDSMLLFGPCVYNGYHSLREAGLLNDVAGIIPEFEAQVEGSMFSFKGYFDLVIEYANGNKIVVEIKTSKPAVKMGEAASCKQGAEFITLNQQINAYHYLGKKLWGDKFLGMYYMNTSFKRHLIAANITEESQARFIGSLKMMHKQIAHEIFLPACGTGTYDGTKDVCSVSGVCPFV